MPLLKRNLDEYTTVVQVDSNTIEVNVNRFSAAMLYVKYVSKGDESQLKITASLKGKADPLGEFFPIVERNSSKIITPFEIIIPDIGNYAFAIPCAWSSEFMRIYGEFVGTLGSEGEATVYVVSTGATY